jgi:hypothetical protein
VRKPQPPRVIVHGHRSYGRLRPSLQPRQCRLRCARAARWHSSLALTGCAHMQPGSGAASTDQPAAATLAPAGARARRLWPRNSASSTDATGGGCADQPKVDSVAPSLPWVQFLLARPLGACTLAEPVVLGQCSATARPLAPARGAPVCGASSPTASLLSPLCLHRWACVCIFCVLKSVRAAILRLIQTLGCKDRP